MTSWEQIQKLTSDLQLAQHSVAKGLSESNCVDIIKILESRRALKLSHSTDGRFYVTHSQLKSDIIRYIHHYGRIESAQLQDILKVDSTSIQPHVNAILREGDVNGIFEMGGFIFTRQCIRDMIREIIEILEEKQCMRVTDLALLMDNVSTPLLEKIFNDSDFPTDKVGRVRDCVYVNSYKKLQESIMMGVIQASLTPVEMRTAAKKHGFDVDLLADTIKSVVANYDVEGVFEGTRYIPDIYKQSQLDAVNAFVKRNGYIEYSLMKTWKISNRDAVLKVLFSKSPSKSFESCYMCSDRLQTLLKSTLICVSEKGCCDLPEIVPSCFTDNDTRSFVDMLAKSSKDPFYTIESTYLMSEAMKKEVHQKLKEFASAYVERASHDERIVEKLKELIANSPSEAKITKKAAKRCSKNPSRLLVEDVFPLDMGAVEKELMKCGVPDEFCGNVASHFASSVQASVNVAASQKIEQLRQHVAGADIFQTTQVEISRSFSVLELIQKSLQKLQTWKSMDDDSLAVCNRYLIKIHCVDLVDTIVARKCAHNGTHHQTNTSQPVSSESRKQLITRHSNQDDRKLLQELNDLVTNAQTLDDFLNKSADPIEKLFEIRLKPIDKKTERDLIIELRESNKAKLECIVDVAQALKISLLLLCIAAKDMYMPLPHKMVPTAVAACKEFLNAGDWTKLKTISDSVTLSMSKNIPLFAGPEDQGLMDDLRSLRDMGATAKSRVSRQ